MHIEVQGRLQIGSKEWDLRLMVDSSSLMDLISNNLVQKLNMLTEQKQKIMLWNVNGKKVATQQR